MGAVSISEVYRFPQAYPNPSGPTLAVDGAFYGTCEHAGEFNHGWIYRLTTNGVITAVVSFAGTNGSFPSGGLVAGSDGALYGTCSAGGAHGIGTVFRVTTEGVLTHLDSFTGTNAPNFGFRPNGLGKGSDGAFYGCTTDTAFRVGAES